MTFGDLIKHSKSEVRGSSFLTFHFIEAYKHVFKVKPSCTGCSISNELSKLANEIKKLGIEEKEIEIKEESIMKNTDKTFVLSPTFNETMLAYVDENKVVRRKFSNKLTDEFVIAYLTNGTEAEIEERKKNFKKFPKGFEASSAEKVEVKEVKKRTRKAK